MTRSNVAPAKRQAPHVASRDEAPKSWDTHVLTGSFSFEPVGIEVANPLSEPLTLRIDIETGEGVRAIAEAQGPQPDGLPHIRTIERRDGEQPERAVPHHMSDSPNQVHPGANEPTVEPRGSTA